MCEFPSRHFGENLILLRLGSSSFQNDKIHFLFILRPPVEDIVCSGSIIFRVNPEDY